MTDRVKSRCAEDAATPGEDLRAELDRLRREHEELKEANALLAKTFESINEAVVVFDPAARAVLSCNPAATRVFGYRALDLIGRNVSILHENPESCDEFMSALRASLDAGAAFNSSCRMRRKDGGTFPAELTVTGFGGDGRAGYVAVVRDVADRLAAEDAERESEEILRALTDDLPAIVAYADSSLRYRFVNRVFENWINRPRSEIIGRRVPEVVGAQRWKRIKPMIAAALSGEAASFEEVFTYPDGEKRFLLAQYIPRLSEDGAVLGVCALLTDISRQKKTEEELINYRNHLELLVNVRTRELEKLNLRLKEEVAGHEISQEKIKSLNRELTGHVKQLEDANRELEAFSYSLAHDLSTPLRVIDGFSRLLEKHYLDRLDGEGRDFIKTIRGNAQKMGRFISDILHLARLGKSEIKKSRIDMNETARLITDEFRGLAAGRDVRFVIADLPPAFGELTLLRQALFNLVSNSVKFTAGREVAVIEISGRAEGGETNYRVRDNGVGFDMKHAGKIWGLFKRLHTDGVFEGTGAGLAIVGRIIERHGGRVWAEGREGEGAEFGFSLPIR